MSKSEPNNIDRAQDAKRSDSSDQWSTTAACGSTEDVSGSGAAVNVTETHSEEIGSLNKAYIGASAAGYTDNDGAHRPALSYSMQRWLSMGSREEPWYGVARSQRKKKRAQKVAKQPLWSVRALFCL